MDHCGFSLKVRRSLNILSNVHEGDHENRLQGPLNAEAKEKRTAERRNEGVKDKERLTVVVRAIQTLHRTKTDLIQIDFL